MKKIIMMVLVIVAALSGITVPTRTAGALYVGNNIEWRNKIKELLGTEDTTGIQCMTVNSEIIWLADKYGNVIVDDRPMDIRPEYSEGVDNYGEGYSVTEGFAAQFKYESSYTWEEWCKQQPDKGPYPVASSWSSDNPDIADVDQNGVVTAKKPGKTVIRAKTLDSGREMAKEITVIRNWVKDEEYIRKARVKYVLSYDKNGDAVCKVTIKNTSKKKYKYAMYFTIYNEEPRDDTYGKLVEKHYKLTLKPKKSKTYTIKVKKLKRYQDITEKIGMSIDDDDPKRVK